MIEKMEFISITGPKADIDRVVDQYLSRYEIHLENALAELNTVQNLSPYLQINPYKPLLSRAEELEALLEPRDTEEAASISLEDAAALVEELDQKLSGLDADKKKAWRSSCTAQRNCCRSWSPSGIWNTISPLC